MHLNRYANYSALNYVASQHLTDPISQLMRDFKQAAQSFARPVEGMCFNEFFAFL